MLQPDPGSRIDIAGILSHEWFGRSLQSVALSVNKGLLEMPDSMLTGRLPGDSIVKSASAEPVRPVSLLVRNSKFKYF